MKYLLVILSFLSLKNLNAQYDGMGIWVINHALYNNPGITGNQNSLSANLSFRNDWINSENHPKTLAFSAHTPLKNDNFNVGIMFINDQIGFNNQNSFLGFGSYKIHTKYGKLKLGLKTGINSLSFHQKDLQLHDALDPAFDFNTTKTTLNLGLGLYFEADDYYFGLSVPEFSNKSSDFFININDKVYWNKRLIGGYKFKINEDFTLNNHLVIKKYGQSKSIVELLPIVQFKKTVEAGLLYKINNAFGFIIGYQINHQLKVNYNFDKNKYNIGANTLGNHEFSVNYRLGKLVESYNPKFF